MLLQKTKIVGVHCESFFVSLFVQCGTMDVDDLMKETFSGILVDAKLERSVVIQGFMKAHHDIEKSGKGFGKAYWGNKWRFKIFDGFYTRPKDPETGLLVDVFRRFHHLIE